MGVYTIRRDSEKYILTHEQKFSDEEFKSMCEEYIVEYKTGGVYRYGTPSPSDIARYLERRYRFTIVPTWKSDASYCYTDNFYTSQKQS